MVTVTLDCPKTSMAISCIWGWMIPHLYIEYAEFRAALDRGIDDARGENEEQEKKKTTTATRALRRGMLVALLVIAGVYVGIAGMVCQLTQQQQPEPDPDQGDDHGPPPPPVTKISAIVIGIGRMLSASLLAYFSIELPRWLGVTYASQKHVDYYKHIRIRDDDVDNNDAATKTNNKDIEKADREKSDPIGQATQDKVQENATETDNENHRTSQVPTKPTAKPLTRMMLVGRKELTFRVCWSILGHFFIMVPLLVLYCCTVPFRTVVVSTLLGSVFGIAIVSCVWRSHTHWSPHHRTVLAMVVSGILALASAAAFAAGGWYVKEVWHNNTDHTHQFTAATFLGWLLLLLVWHGVYYRLTQRKLVETHHHNTTNTNTNTTTTTTNSTQHPRHQRRHTRIRRKYNNEDDTGSISFIVNRHHNITMDRDEVQQIKDEWRYGQSTFQPPKSVTLCFATPTPTRLSPAAKTTTTTTTTPTTYNTNNDVSLLSPTKFKSVVSSLMGKIKMTKTITETNNGRTTSIRPTCNDNTNNNNTNDDDEEILPTNLNLKNDNDDTGLNQNDDAHVASTNRLYTVAGAAGAATETTTTQYNETTDTDSNRPRNDSTDGTLVTSTTSATVESYTIRNSDSKDADDEIDNDDGDLRHTATTTDTIGTNESDLDIIIDRDDDQEGDHATTKNPTLWYMMKVNSCCRRRRHYDVPRRGGCDQFSRVLKWFLYTMAATVHLFLTIIIIGATIQQNVVREALTPTFELLYPQDYNEGEMCAWNKVPTYTTTGGSTNTIVDYSKSDIRTFPSLQDVHDANYTVIHCGECGHCSNYNDLSLQWTTRTYLAESARECGTQILFGGTVEDVQECNEHSIGFTDDCAMCWTVDEMCCKTNCFFIFLQSVFTNSLSNFEVDPNADITTAACDEALCGPEFVPCSGATRRRMNIVSDIARPTTQQCNVVTEDWSLVFDHDN